MAGLRTCELVRSEPTDPVLNWEDILWTKDLIHVRHEGAKQTRSRDHKRYVPLEPEAAKILKPLADYRYRPRDNRGLPVKISRVSRADFLRVSAKGSCTAFGTSTFNCRARASIARMMEGKLLKLGTPLAHLRRRRRYCSSTAANCLMEPYEATLAKFSFANDQSFRGNILEAQR